MFFAWYIKDKNNYGMILSVYIRDQCCIFKKSKYISHNIADIAKHFCAKNFAITRLFNKYLKVTFLLTILYTSFSLSEQLSTVQFSSTSMRFPSLRNHFYCYILEWCKDSPPHQYVIQKYPITFIATHYYMV